MKCSFIYDNGTHTAKNAEKMLSVSQKNRIFFSKWQFFFDFRFFIPVENEPTPGNIIFSDSLSIFILFKGLVITELVESVNASFSSIIAEECDIMVSISFLMGMLIVEGCGDAIILVFGALLKNPEK